MFWLEFAKSRKEWNGEIVNIYQKPQALINYFIDTFQVKDIGFSICS
jgi:hypothetical protein